MKADNRQRSRRLTPVGRQRDLWTALLLLPVLAVLAGSAAITLDGEESFEFPCWVLPRGQVVFVPGANACPLRFLDEIRTVELDGVSLGWRNGSPLDRLRAALAGDREGDPVLRTGIVRDGVEQWALVPLVFASDATHLSRLAAALIAACGLMWIPLFLLRRSTAPAAVPIGVLYSSIVVVVVTAIAGRESEWMTRAAVLGLVTVPGALAHLSFVFPRPGRAFKSAPELIRVPYAVCAVLASISLFALDRSPLLWRSFLYLMLFLAAAGWGVLLLSCAFAVRESVSAAERSRAGLVFYGTLFVPVLPTLALTWRAPVTETMATYLWVSALAMPLPIGLAISRYNLFDLGLDVRHWVGRLIYFGLGALASSVLVYLALGFVEPWHSLRDLGVLFGTALGCLLVVEAMRRPILGFLESMFTPRLDQLRVLRERYVDEMAELRDEEAAARRLLDVLRDGLEARTGCVFLAGSETGGSGAGDWRPVQLFGPDAPTQPGLISRAERVLEERQVVHLALEVEEGSLESRLLEAGGVEIVASVESGGQRFGIVLLGPNERGAPYTGVELDFVAMAAAHAGTAIHNARLAGQLVATERNAATARVAVALMHDIGKDLGWIRRLVTRMAKKGAGHETFEESVSEVRELTDSVVGRMRSFMLEATESRREPPDVLRLDELLDSWLRRVVVRHGDRRVEQSIEPEIRGLRCHENIGRVAANLVDNALQASTPDGRVVIAATLEADRLLKLSVSDDGCGISADVLQHAFEPGFTTHREQGGMGVGLSVSRDIVEQMGGKIELARLRGGGTCATVVIPMASLQKRNSIAEAETE